MKANTTSVTIVILGDFDPNAFMPDALVEEKIISSKDADLIKYQTLVRDQIIHINLAWGEMLVAKDRFQVSTIEAPYVRICDFAIKAINDSPIESKIKAFGINLESHFDLGSRAKRDELGVKLAPPSAWGEWGTTLKAGMDSDDVTKHGGMTLLQMREPFSEEKISGWLDINVGPSSKVGESSGVYFRSNHHHQLIPEDKQRSQADSTQNQTNGYELLGILADTFDRSIIHAGAIFSGVLNS